MPIAQPFDLSEVDINDVRITSSGEARESPRTRRPINPGEPASRSRADISTRRTLAQPELANTAFSGDGRDDLRNLREEFAPRRVQSNWTPPNHRRETRPDPTGPARMRSELVIAYANPPKAVRDAYDVAREAIDAYDEALRAVLDIAIDQSEEEMTNKELVERAIRSGEERPTLQRTDWHAEAIEREVRYEMTWRAAKTASADFQRVSRINIDHWLSANLRDLDGAHAKARKALATAAPLIREWRTKVEAAEKLAIAAGKHGPGFHQSGEPELWRKMNSAVQRLHELEKVLNSDDPVISGQYLLETDEDALVPPLHTRQNISRAAGAGADWAVQILGQIESEEGYKKTQFTPIEERHRFQGMGGRLRAALSQKRLRPQDA